MADETVEARNNKVVDFVYSIKGDNELDLFELVPLLSALGEVIQEGNRVLNPELGKIRIAVKPFEKGSFNIETLLSTENLNTLYAAHQAGGPHEILAVLTAMGFIKSKVEGFISLLDLLKRLRGQPPQEIKSIDNGKKYEVKGQDNQITEINGPVQNVYNNPIIASNLTIIYVNTLEKPNREKVQSYIRGDNDSLVEITKDDAPALREIPPIPVEDGQPEVVEHTNVVFLNPKRGSFDGEGDRWSFRKCGKQGEIIKANIKDQGFLEKLESGEYRLNGEDVLKVELHEKQKVAGSQIQTTNDILKVLGYKPAQNGPKQTSLFDGGQNN